METQFINHYEDMPLVLNQIVIHSQTKYHHFDYSPLNIVLLVLTSKGWSLRRLPLWLWRRLLPFDN